MPRNHSGDVCDMFSHSCKHLNSFDTSKTYRNLHIPGFGSSDPISSHDPADTLDKAKLKKILKSWNFERKNQVLHQCENRFGATGFAAAFGMYITRKIPSRSTIIDFASVFFLNQTPRPSGFPKLANQAYEHLRFLKFWNFENSIEKNQFLYRCENHSGASGQALW